ncbi:MAG: hypothetical protein IPG23_15220 [Burkholderiales bacterium]|nr:hypothetical protein [Burkholderiales bacterium]
MTALASGDTTYSINHIPLALGMIKGGRLRALATTGAKRSPAFPDLPTVGESGIWGYEPIPGLRSLRQPICRPLSKANCRRHCKQRCKIQSCVLS